MHTSRATLILAMHGMAHIIANLDQDTASEDEVALHLNDLRNRIDSVANPDEAELSIAEVISYIGDMGFRVKLTPDQFFRHTDDLQDVRQYLEVDGAAPTVHNSAGEFGARSDTLQDAAAMIRKALSILRDYPPRPDHTLVRGISEDIYNIVRLLHLKLYIPNNQRSNYSHLVPLASVVNEHSDDELTPPARDYSSCERFGGEGVAPEDEKFDLAVEEYHKRQHHRRKQLLTQGPNGAESRAQAADGSFGAPEPARPQPSDDSTFGAPDGATGEGHFGGGGYSRV